MTSTTEFYQNIPLELKQYPQWVCWKIVMVDGRPTKVPFDPKTHKKASVVNYKTWSTFDQAVWCVEQGFYPGIGFVLTKSDPYIFIDLDNPEDNPEIVANHTRVLSLLPSYTETSPSLNGAHVIGRGVCVRGKRDPVKKLEMYDSGRYMTMTGYCTNHFGQIVDVQEVADLLYKEMGGNDLQTEQNTFDVSATYDDFKVIELCRSTKNGHVFLDLFEGRWQLHYSTNSEADLAIFNMIATISQNKDQTTRIFYMSALGKRDKNQRKDIIARLVNLSFENVPPPIDVSALINNASSVLERRAQLVEAPSLDKLPVSTLDVKSGFADWALLDDLPVPPGLVGDVMRYAYRAAPRPVAEACLLAGVALIAGICGRTYNVNGTGLNMYCLLLGDTGVGKNTIALATDNIMKDVVHGSPQVPTKVPAASQFVGMNSFPSSHY